MYPLTHHAPGESARQATRDRFIHAVCPDCHTADATSLLPVTNVLVLYHSCARCHLVWATNFTGTPINKH